MAGKALVVANGVLPAHKLVHDEVSRADYVLAADGGMDKLLSLGLLPSAVLGDFDSSQAIIPVGVERVEAPDQDFTDLEKSVQFLRSRGFVDITLIGVTGERLDHTFGAMAILCKYGLRLVDDFGVATSMHGPESRVFTVKPGQVVSLMPCGVVRGLSTAGLKWPIKNEEFHFAQRDGTSNAAVGELIELEVKDGMLIVYVHHPN